MQHSGVQQSHRRKLTQGNGVQHCEQQGCLVDEQRNYKIRGQQPHLNSNWGDQQRKRRIIKLFL